MSCKHDCPAPPFFPALIENRPALSQIGYRIGDYSSFRAHMLALLDQSTVLSAWTHREADDPAIALLECGAIAGELLAFYQELYANETYLRTAQWRESVTRLVALGGYRLAPGIGGQAKFALEVKGNEVVRVPAGFVFKAELESGDGPAVFESQNESTAYPWLSKFHLYRPRRGAVPISADTTRLELTAVAGRADLASRSAVDIRPGDRFILVPRENPWEAQSGAFSPQKRSEVLIVKTIENLLERILIEFEGRLSLDRGVEIDLYPIGRSFRHFGHNAPPSYGELNETTGVMNFNPTYFLRSSDLEVGDGSDLYSNLGPRELPLDTEVDDLATGGQLVITGNFTAMVTIDTDIPTKESDDSGKSDIGLEGYSGGREIKGSGRIVSIVIPSPLAVVRQIEEVRQDTLIWGGMNAGASVPVISEVLAPNPEITSSSYDIRQLQLHEVIGGKLTLRAESDWDDGDFGLDTELNFFGTHAEAVSLAGRELLLEDDAGVLQSVRVVSEAADFDSSGRDETNAWIWSLNLDQPPGYSREAFDERDNRITVYGNLVAADQGESQDDVVLGNGDARQVFQTFPLPKAPLSYLLHNERTPPQVPQLEVYVDGILWQRVESFFTSQPTDRVYLVREDEAGNSLVQFGDGEHGVRLPSGVGNLRARYRVGVAAYGPLAAEKTPKANDKLQPLSKLWMPQPVTGGAGAELHEEAREAAPARLQSLGRLVGLADYEAEALAQPGVRKALADWVASDGMPRLQLVVLTDGASETEANAVATAINSANRCRGASRFSIDTVRGLRQYLHLDLTLGYAADRLAEDIEPAVIASLGVEQDAEEPEQGLFGYADRRFGQEVHVSQVIAVVQQLSGVNWVRVDALQSIPLGDPPQTDPLALVIASNKVRHQRVECPGDRLLALHTEHLYLNLTQDVAAKECEA
ncbi:MAG: hypothetical protein ABW170_10185 [Candidatus Thiodiazotropha sp. L084R]